MIKAMETILGRYEESLKTNRKNHSLQYLALGVFYCLGDDIKNGRRAFMKAIKLYPFEIKHYLNLFTSLFGVKTFRKVKAIRDK
jgi:hypothetical protein